MTAFLVKNNIPFDVAESWPEVERSAHFIIFGELAGGVWDWGRMCWEKPKDER